MEIQEIWEGKVLPIINGSVNPRLTPELFSELPYETKGSVIHNLSVSLGFAHCFPEVDHKVFEPHPDRNKWSWSTVTEENADAMFVEVKEAYRSHHAKLLNKTSTLHYELGERIYHAQKELGFGGMVELSKHRMKGYIGACGSWNDFKAPNVSAAIGRMHELAPRMDYGVNNPNTGGIIHKLKTVSGCEYIIMEFDFINKATLERVKEFFKAHWEPKGRSIQADSIRFEEVEHTGGYFGIELIWWWD